MDWSVEAVRRTRPASRESSTSTTRGRALPPKVVVDTVVGHLRRESEIGGYEAAAAAADQVEHTYTAITRLIGAPSEVAIVGERHPRLGHGLLRLAFAPGDRS